MPQRPMHMELKPAEPVRPQLGLTLRCKTWEAEAALRMLENNLSPEIALLPDELIVYGGAGRACRNWREYHRIVAALKDLAAGEQPASLHPPRPAAGRLDRPDRLARRRRL